MIAILLNSLLEKPATEENLARVTLVDFKTAKGETRFVIGPSGTGPKARMMVINKREATALIAGKSQEEILALLKQKTGKAFQIGKKPGIYVAQ